MSMTPKEIWAIKEWMKNNPIVLDCPMCRKPANWETGQIVGVPIRADDTYALAPDGGLKISIVAMVQLRCSSCGFLAEFSANSMGID